ncbi:MAG: hypothetical protein HeimC3_39620 [Candidatus Heimdallarchaeota archaeon LC_3]|nr:MAG: hypothetical protein HeimC3_39620 [Candidatus Heimdallarchaeota archaeon LC_3]
MLEIEKEDDKDLYKKINSFVGDIQEKNLLLKGISNFNETFKSLGYKFKYDYQNISSIEFFGIEEDLIHFEELIYDLILTFSKFGDSEEFPIKTLIEKFDSIFEYHKKFQANVLKVLKPHVNWIQRIKSDPLKFMKSNYKEVGKLVAAASTVFTIIYSILS